MENLDYNNENTERKYLGKNQFFKLKHSLSDLEKDFMELKDRELKDREEKIKREIKELFRLSCVKMIWISLKNKS